ncbi:hypothetical protein WJU23_04010 [Prosthecobacter sp. SYSU 5D2]|uniref:hypothetical protein n=1 Tax=Prosthecobacter sp. SYSU 5D2 TaxID=3134134 RepID=UPI0031FECC5F
MTGQTSPHELSLRELPLGERPPAALAPWQRMLTPSGVWRVLEVSHGRTPGSLDIPAGTILWAGVYPESLVESVASGLQIIGDIAAPVPVVEELTPLKQDAQSLTVPPGLNLARLMQWTAFGVEERVRAEDEADNTRWSMAVGRKPGGLYSSALWRLPRWPEGAAWKISVTLSGQGSVQVGLSADIGKGHGDPLILDDLSLTAQGSTHTWQIPAKWLQARSLRLSLLSHSDQSVAVQIPSVIATPQPGKRQETAAACRLGIWDWSADPARWMRLQPLWKQAGIHVLQLALPRQAEGCLESLKQLQNDGFHLTAVEGDPYMILPEALPAVLARHQTLAGWKGQGLDAVQYDVEPYLLPGFRLQPEAWYHQWAGLYQQISTLGKIPVEAVVPFWLLQQKEGPALLEKLARTSHRIVVMNYRSDVVEAAAWGTAWLEWGAKHRLPVSLAIECGPIPDVQLRTFRTAPSGRLWVSPWPGQGTAVILYADAVAPGEDAQTLAEVRQSLVPGARTTLKGQPPEAVAEMLRSLQDVARQMKLPAAMQPEFLLHEPEEALLNYLGEKTP